MPGFPVGFASQNDPGSRQVKQHGRILPDYE
jgi:hypothetical protein